ncbi:prolipoprotein diacylglyceryl transferase [Candidatus Endowatersipora endosymbiont of Watersipora subatra]|uniref:prolipoprotein diacylglyceryl transferase n=1 Tax=Candidatus Endowatersipora endosymbiont of Watersipora subatra TaxID=3077946 RepID=UPI00312CA411
MSTLSYSQSLLQFLSIDPILIEIGPIIIHWYGISYMFGILLGWFFARQVVSRSSLWSPVGAPFTQIDLDDFMIWAIIGIIVGGRLGYVLFYNFGYYLMNPLDIFAIWCGGMSFHGGALASLLSMILFSRQRSFSPFSLFDIMAVSSCFGLFFGRLANFINSELWGRPSDVSWSFIFSTGGPVARHPSQLYEAGLEGVVLFIILSILIFKFKKLVMPGFISGAWGVGYSTARIFIEFFREPDAHIGYLAGGWITMGMILSFPMIPLGIWGMMSAKSRVVWHDRQNIVL